MTFSKIRGLIREDAGALAPLLGLLLLLLIGMMGFAIDIGRSALVHARLVSALDAAGLAVGARMTTADYTEDAKKFVAANFKANYVGATVKDVTATPNATKSVITLNATADMPTAFMKLFGTNMVTVKATSEVTRATTGLELVMALDTTGSMAESMPALKEAANLLVDYVFGADATAKDLYVGLVPFSHTVTLGQYPTYKKWMDEDSAKQQVASFPKEYQKYWPEFSVGCIEERANGLDQTDDVPEKKNSTLFPYYFYPHDSAKESLATYLDDGGPNRYCPSTVLPMTPVKAKVKTAIQAMTANGNTHVNVGAVWSWRMLSPKWRGYWAGDMAANSLPLDYGTKRMNKAAVIMTDGKNTMSKDVYTAYGKLSEGRLGATDWAGAETALDSRLNAVCNSMKAAGINVYTVAFRNPGATIETLLRNCATKAEFYFPATNSVALKEAFQVIGGSLSNLRVSK